MLVLTDLSDIIDSAHAAWQDTADEIDTANTQALQSVRYNWPRTTVRQNGDTAGSPRDIIDTGKLIGSQNLDRLDSDTFELSWGADYAAEVHEGKTLKSGVNLPARRWTKEAIRGDDTADPEWQNPQAILNVPTHFATEFSRISGIS